MTLLIVGTATGWLVSTHWLTAPTAPLVVVNSTTVPSSSPQSPALAHIGEEITSGSWRYLVTGTGYPGKSLNFASTVGYLDASGTWLVVYLTLRNRAPAFQELDLGGFLVSDSTGRTYPMTDNQTEANIWRERAVLAQLGRSVPPASSIDTGLLFDVPVGSSGFRLHLPGVDTVVYLGA